MLRGGAEDAIEATADVVVELVEVVGSENTEDVTGLGVVLGGGTCDVLSWGRVAGRENMDDLGLGNDED